MDIESHILFFFYIFSRYAFSRYMVKNNCENNEKCFFQYGRPARLDCKTQIDVRIRKITVLRHRTRCTPYLFHPERRCRSITQFDSPFYNTITDAIKQISSANISSYITLMTYFYPFIR